MIIAALALTLPSPHLEASLTDYPAIPANVYAINSPFAAKWIIQVSQDKNYTADQTLLPGRIVGWDPENGDAISLTQSAIYLGGKKKADIPPGLTVFKTCYGLDNRLRMIAASPKEMALFDGTAWKEFKSPVVMSDREPTPLSAEVSRACDAIIFHSNPASPSEFAYADANGLKVYKPQSTHAGRFLITAKGPAWFEYTDYKQQRLYLNGKLVGEGSEAKGQDDAIWIEGDSGTVLVGVDGNVYKANIREVAHYPVFIADKTYDGNISSLWSPPISWAGAGCWGQMITDILGNKFVIGNGATSKVASADYSQSIYARAGATPCLVNEYTYDTIGKSIGFDPAKLDLSTNQSDVGKVYYQGIFSVSPDGRYALISGSTIPPRRSGIRSVSLIYYVDLSNGFFERINLPVRTAMNTGSTRWRMDGTCFVQIRETVSGLNQDKFKLLVAKEVQ